MGAQHWHPQRSNFWDALLLIAYWWGPWKKPSQERATLDHFEESEAEDYCDQDVIFDLWSLVLDDQIDYSLAQDREDIYGSSHDLIRSLHFLHVFFIIFPFFGVRVLVILVDQPVPFLRNRHRFQLLGAFQHGLGGLSERFGVLNKLRGCILFDNLWWWLDHRLDYWLYRSWLMKTKVLFPNSKMMMVAFFVFKIHEAPGLLPEENSLYICLLDP